MSRLPLVLLIGCIELERPDDSGTTGDGYTGWERYQFGENPGALNCDLYWNVQGAATQISCPECVFAYDLSFTMDDSRSTDDGNCFQAQEQFTRTYVLVQEAGEYSVGTYSAGSVTVFAPAEFDASSGKFWYSTGNTGYSYGAYYYTQYTSGYGLIQ